MAVPEHGELVARAVALRPLFRANAERTEKERRIPKENLAAMEEAGMFRLFVPRAFGGYASPIRTYVDVVAELSRGCSSSGWIAFIDDATDWLVAQYAEEVQAEIYKTGPDTRIGGIFETANAHAEAAEGGIKVNGSWGFASGCHHAQWAALGVPLPGRPPGPEGEGLVLIPIGELAIKDTWYVAGMCGTGSDTLIAKDVFVPARRIYPWASAMNNNHARHLSGDVYGAPFLGAVILMAAPPILGMAQAALDFTLEKMKAGKKISYTSYMDGRLAPGTQANVAQAATLIDTAFLLIRHWADEMDQAALAKRDFDYPTRARVRADIGHAMRSCREAVDHLLNVQGASSFALSNPLQRVWRDLSTASRHAILSPEIGQELYAKALLGLKNNVTPLL